jgi:hypothetical protein
MGAVGMCAMQYPIPDEVFASMSGVTRQIVHWILSEDVQRALADDCSCKLTINVKRDDVVAVIEKHRRLNARNHG